MAHQTAIALDFLIIGGSSAGLSAAYALRRVGHRVLVLEQNSDFFDERRCGGYRIPPNMSKVFYHWGLGDRVRKVCLKSNMTCFNRFESGEDLGGHVWVDELMRETGGDFLFAKLADIRKFLYQLGHEAGAKYRANAKVVSVDVPGKSVTLESGEVLRADVIIGADGRHGLCRGLLLECQSAPKSTYTGMTMYNALIPGDKIRADPQLSKFLGSAAQYVWFGNGCAGMLFEVGNNSDMGLHLYVPDEEDRGTNWDCTVEEMLRYSSGAESQLQKFARMARNISRVSVYDESDLEDWVHDDGPLVLIGDAAHPMPPGSIQGTCMAIEDSAVLAKLFGHLISADQVTSFLYAFPELRQGRTKSVRVNEMGNIYFMAMPDDAGAIQRDEHFKSRRDKNLSPLEDESGDASGVWESIKETWCYDAEDEADDWWVGWGMLRLRSQQTELDFGMEFQNTPLSLQVTVQS